MESLSFLEKPDKEIIQTHNKKLKTLWIELHLNKIEIDKTIYFLLIIIDITEKKLKLMS